MAEGTAGAPLLAAEGEAREDKKPQSASGFGGAHIGFFASFCLLVNNITGPGMVQVPNIFQQAGWLFPTIMFLFTGVFIGIVAMYLAKAVALMKGDKDRIEFNELAKDVFPRWLYILTMIILIANFQATNISSIVVSAQTMDNTLLAAAHKSCALYVYPAQAPGCISSVDVSGGNSSSSSSGGVTDSPFGNSYVISLGYIVTLMVTLPIGYFNLEDQMWVQKGSFILLVVCIIAWVVQFFYSGMAAANMPVAEFSNYGPVISTVVFNFGFISTLPSWLAERSPTVSVAKASWSSIVVSGVMFLALGLLGGFSNLNFGGSASLLAILDDPDTPNVLLAAKIASYVFAPVALLSGIPVFSVIIRYNLMNEGWPKWAANLFAVVFPWVVALFFFAGDLLATLINWSSAVLFVLLNFVLPIMIYIIHVRKTAAGHGSGSGAGAKLLPVGASGLSLNAAGAAAAVIPAGAALGYASDAVFPTHTDDVASLSRGGEDDDVHLPAAATAAAGDDIQELPPGLRQCCTPMTAAWIIAAISVVLSIVTFALQIYGSETSN